MKLSKCNRCGLYKNRSNVVKGRGSLHSDIMFIGEAPGKEEDRDGKPFVGRAGKIFSNILDILGRNRKQIFLTNTVKCRPCDTLASPNRKPKNIEIFNCVKWLIQEINIVNPKIIVTMGDIAMSSVTGLSGISDKAGRTFSGNNFLNDYENEKLLHKDFYVFVLYHPAFLIYKPNFEEEYIGHVKKLKKLFAEMAV
ncbi:MAG: uracil-DNA glycosylase [Candidatus Lokiarchaeota archaeon]|nr:uracil-DNA glycosylase [Candidatus Lokiarchaeota archaeon]